MHRKRTEDSEREHRVAHKVVGGGGARELGADIHHGFEQLAGRMLELICGETARCHAA